MWELIVLGTRSWDDPPSGSYYPIVRRVWRQTGMIDQSERAKDAMRKLGYTRERPGA